jgi:hypothetical protein
VLSPWREMIGQRRMAITGCASDAWAEYLERCMKLRLGALRSVRRGGG